MPAPFLAYGNLGHIANRPITVGYIEHAEQQAGGNLSDEVITIGRIQNAEDPVLS
ncbi:MAG: hypothetical protein H0W31_00260 [Actinobacteria bacterium]|nr:hypothetical protein [Actinomycetota bacterium]